MLILLIMSSRTRLNSKGERGSPCLMPRLMEMGPEVTLFLENVVYMFVYISLMTSIIWLGTPCLLRDLRIELWETVSKALEMSRKDIYSRFLLLLASLMI